MLSKIILISLFGTGVIGTSAASGITPTGMELACGALRIESGNGKGLRAHLDSHAGPALTINLNDGRTLVLTF
ncbi:MAG: hypothetical protein JKX72_07520 [Robiginitomaculum sp.]|nr:hypothetical protein [Robiginitomaculum sp.]